MVQSRLLPLLPDGVVHHTGRAIWSHDLDALPGRQRRAALRRPGLPRSRQRARARHLPGGDVDQRRCRGRSASGTTSAARSCAPSSSGAASSSLSSAHGGVAGPVGARSRRRHPGPGMQVRQVGLGAGRARLGGRPRPGVRVPPSARRWPRRSGTRRPSRSLAVLDGDAGRRGQHGARRRRRRALPLRRAARGPRAGHRAAAGRDRPAREARASGIRACVAVPTEAAAPLAALARGGGDDPGDATWRPGPPRHLGRTAPSPRA